jgi:hypothetical protein
VKELISIRDWEIHTCERDWIQETHLYTQSERKDTQLERKDTRVNAVRKKRHICMRDSERLARRMHIHVFDHDTCLKMSKKPLRTHLPCVGSEERQQRGGKLVERDVISAQKHRFAAVKGGTLQATRGYVEMTLRSVQEIVFHISRRICAGA